jgi:hypothetical protein
MCAAINETKNDPTQTSGRVIEQVSSAIANADNTVTQAVRSLTLVHQARVAQLSRAEAAANARYGGSSPQAKAAKAAVTASKATLSRIALLQKRVNLRTPEVPSNGWVLYGHVYHSTLKPASAYSVFFVDEQNAYRKDIGFAYTGRDGSFHLSFAGDPNAAEAVVFLEIVNDKAEPVYLSSTAFQAQIGTANYQDITLPADEPVLGDPPPAIRAIAMPQTAAGSSTPSTEKAASENSPSARKTRIKRTKPSEGQ